MNTECKKMLLIAIAIGIISFTAFYTLDNTIGVLFKNHNTTDKPASITKIDVTGNGSSGTGDVQNVQQTTVVSSGETTKTQVSTTQSDTNTAKVTVNANEKLSGTDYTPT